ncbi:MAG: HD domain-containing protein, partial [Erysipelotrichaceae bacterium]|nr:HD domain-containing protein [Erysipelotrichaceae bacterium]
SKYLEIVHFAEKLKNVMRHSYTSNGRHESTAEHSWRLALMAFFLKDEFEHLDMNKVITMCLIHDLGEVITGDIPVFDKTSKDRETEADLLNDWVQSLPEPYASQMSELYQEMETLETDEAKLYKALDQMEAVDQHNLADLSTWEDHEVELQLHHGEKNAKHFEVTQRLRDAIRQETLDKIK